MFTIDNNLISWNCFTQVWVETGWNVTEWKGQNKGIEGVQLCRIEVQEQASTQTFLSHLGEILYPVPYNFILMTCLFTNSGYGSKVILCLWMGQEGLHEPEMI